MSCWGRPRRRWTSCWCTWRAPSTTRAGTWCTATPPSPPAPAYRSSASDPSRSSARASPSTSSCPASWTCASLSGTSCLTTGTYFLLAALSPVLHVEGSRKLLVSCLTQVGSLRMCLDPVVVPPLADFLLLAVLGVLHHILSVPSVCIFKTAYCFRSFYIQGTMFQASTTTLFENKFLLVSSLAACGLRHPCGRPVSLFFVIIFHRCGLPPIIFHICSVAISSHCFVDHTVHCSVHCPSLLFSSLLFVTIPGIRMIAPALYLASGPGLAFS